MVNTVWYAVNVFMTSTTLSLAQLTTVGHQLLDCTAYFFIVGKHFWCSTAFGEYPTQLDLWKFPALKKYQSNWFCFISSNSLKWVSKMMLEIWFYTEQEPQENRAWRGLGMLSGSPSCSKTGSSVPDKMLPSISRGRIIWGQLCPTKKSGLLWICHHLCMFCEYSLGIHTSV